MEFQMLYIETKANYMVRQTHHERCGRLPRTGVAHYERVWTLTRNGCR